MSLIDRRTLLTGLPLAASAAALPQASTAPQRAGQLKITKLAYYRSSIRWRDLLFVEVYTDGGIVGLGEGTCHGRVDVVEAALRWLEPYVIGMDPAGPEKQWERIAYRLTRWSSGIIPRTALSALDIAFWDIEGKRLGVPVWRLLGGSIQPRFRNYHTHWDATVGQPASPEAYAKRAEETVNAGWTAVKFSIPNRGTESERIAATVAILSAMRKAVGDKLDIGLECSESFTTRTAIRMAHALEPYHPLFMEEPLPRENPPSAFGELAAKSAVPVATGEGILSRYDFRPLLEAKGAAIIQPDVVKCGGITEIRKIAALAECYGVEVAPHMCYGPVAHVASLQSMSVCRNFVIHEWEGADDKLFQEATNGTYPVQKDGYLTLPDKPGLGIEFDAAGLAKRYPFTNLGSQVEQRGRF
jgi:galactonate dehydratase